jgi:diguanylate cyclase (GGDEF)-like protein
MQGDSCAETLPWRMLQTLAQAIAARMGRQCGRLPRVAYYAREIGLVLGWDEARLGVLRAASILHDAGELAAPAWGAAPAPAGRPAADSWNAHVVAGAAMLESMGCHGEAAMVRSHHEYWDGSGYPDGLRGEAIPAGARVLAVADCLAVLPLPEALEALRRGSGAVFDPAIVTAVARDYREIERAVSKGNCESGVEGWLESVSAAARRDGLLNELAGVLGDSLSLPETLGELDARLRRLIGYHAMAVWTPRENRLAAAYVSGEEARWLCSLEMPYGRGVSGRVAQTRDSACNGDPAEEAEYAGEGAGVSPLRSVLAVPLERGGELAGVLALYHRDSGAFREDDLGVLLRIRKKLAAAVDNALKYESIQRLATEDPATSLPNERALFLRLDADLARCRRNRGSLAVVVCDVDGAHGMGRRSGVLRAVAAGLRSVCREDDCVARMGDRFVLVLGAFAESHLPEMRKRIEAFLGDLSPAARGKRPPAAKVAAAFYPDDGGYAEDLLAVAEARMNQAGQGQMAEEAILHETP